MNCEKVTGQCVKFIQDKVKEAGAKGIVLGISGGIDSSVVAALCIKAVGADKCKLISQPATKGDGSKWQMLLCETLGVDYDVFCLEPILAQFSLDRMDSGHKLAWANLQARLRMVIQYYIANSDNKLVVGTTNKTEAMIGYYTKYGDGGVDIEPIADLYKTEVWELGKYLEVPSEIIDRAPTAGLWEGQTDEDEIGMTYKELDEILICTEKNIIVKDAYRKELDIVVKMISKSEHKRHMPPSPKLEKE